MRSSLSLSLVSLLLTCWEIIWHDNSYIDISAIIVVTRAQFKLNILIDAELNVIRAHFVLICESEILRIVIISDQTFIIVTITDIVIGML